MVLEREKKNSRLGWVACCGGDDDPVFKRSRKERDRLRERFLGLIVKNLKDTARNIHVFLIVIFRLYANAPTKD